MNTLSKKKECQAELKRLDIIDGLEQELGKPAFDKVKDPSPSDPLTLAPKLLMEMPTL